MKAQRAYLYKDIAALERRVATLLTHLERAIEPAVTDQDRARPHPIIEAPSRPFLPVIRI
jgi:hypothetical protein